MRVKKVSKYRDDTYLLRIRALHCCLVDLTPPTDLTPKYLLELSPHPQTHCLYCRRLTETKCRARWLKPRNSHVILNWIEYPNIEWEWLEGLAVVFINTELIIKMIKGVPAKTNAT